MGIQREFQARRKLPAEDLACRFEVGIRTVHRDAMALLETGFRSSRDRALAGGDRRQEAIAFAAVMEGREPPHDRSSHT